LPVVEDADVVLDEPCPVVEVAVGPFWWMVQRRNARPGSLDWAFWASSAPSYSGSRSASNVSGFSVSVPS